MKCDTWIGLFLLIGNLTYTTDLAWRHNNWFILPACICAFMGYGLWLDGYLFGRIARDSLKPQAPDPPSWD